MKKADPEHPGTTTVRLPPALHKEIKEAAAAAGHSMNVEIVRRLGAPVGETLRDIARQNMKTHELIQVIIDAISPRR